MRSPFSCKALDQVGNGSFGTIRKTKGKSQKRSSKSVAVTFERRKNQNRHNVFDDSPVVESLSQWFARTRLVVDLRKKEKKGRENEERLSGSGL